MSVQSELLALQASHPLLQVETVVGWAQAHPTSALHASFTWDNDVAGHQFRLWQARQLIAIHIINVEGVRQLVSLSIDRTNQQGGGYRDLNTVLAAPAMREMLLADALRELERVQMKYETLVELASVWVAVNNVKKKKSKHKKKSFKAKDDEKRPTP